MPENQPSREKALLAGFRAPGMQPGETDDPYIELGRLADTSGAEVADTLTQPQGRLTPQFYIPSANLGVLHAFDNISGSKPGCV